MCASGMPIVVALIDALLEFYVRSPPARRSRSGPGCRTQGTLGGGNDPLGTDARQAPEVARDARPLMTGPARQCPGLDDFREPTRIAPGEGPFGQRRPEQLDDGVRRRGGDVQRTAVSSDEQRRACDERANSVS